MVPHVIIHVHYTTPTWKNFIHMKTITDISHCVIEQPLLVDTSIITDITTNTVSDITADTIINISIDTATDITVDRITGSTCNTITDVTADNTVVCDVTDRFWVTGT